MGWPYICGPYKRYLQSASIAWSQCLVTRFGGSSSCNFLLAWLHTSCSIAHRPGELPQYMLNQTWDRAIDALCTVLEKANLQMKWSRRKDCCLLMGRKLWCRCADIKAKAGLHLLRHVNAKTCNAKNGKMELSWGWCQGGSSAIPPIWASNAVDKRVTKVLGDTDYVDIKMRVASTV